jgi:lipoprotein-anchoring transpeptidase ErfK/SrfK
VSSNERNPRSRLLCQAVVRILVLGRRRWASLVCDGLSSAGSLHPMLTIGFPSSSNRSRSAASNDRDPALVAKAEILLDRAHVSPGEIDGLDGDNFHNAIAHFSRSTASPSPAIWTRPRGGALMLDGARILKAYTITLADAAGPFTRAIPSNLEAMARLPGLSYTSAQAELAEKFHMSPTLLPELNPRADFARAGTELIVANVPEMLLRSGRPSVEDVPPPNPPKANNDLPEVTIVVDKPARNVRVYDRDGKFLAFYPATIGSEEKPAASGDSRSKAFPGTRNTNTTPNLRGRASIRSGSSRSAPAQTIPSAGSGST